MVVYTIILEEDLELVANLSRTVLFNFCYLDTN